MILISARAYVRQTGGNTRYIRTVADGLRDRGLEMTLAGPSRPGTREWALYEALRMQQSAVLRGAEAAWYPVDTGPVRRVRGVKTVLTLHGVAALHEPTVRSPVAGQLWLRRATAAARAADKIITVSNSSAEDIVTLIGESARDRIVPIHHGISEDWFTPAAEGALDGLSHDIDLDRPFALYYGNLEPRKNLPLAISALALVREQHPDLQFLVSGSPAWQSDETLALIHATPWTHHIGRRTDDEIRALLAAARVFVFPSRYEGFGFPVLEAMASGAPVACTRRGALGEVVGDAAFTSDSLTSEGFADACLRALRADRRTTAALGVEHARRYTWDVSIDRHLRLFRDEL